MNLCENDTPATFAILSKSLIVKLSRFILLLRFCGEQPIRLASSARFMFNLAHNARIWSDIVKMASPLEHIPKFRNGTGKILANASTSLLGLLRANTRIFPVPRI
jgi:hypothetical protein